MAKQLIPDRFNVAVRFRNDADAGKLVYYHVHEHRRGQIEICPLVCGYHNDTAFEARRLGTVMKAIYRQVSVQQIYEVQIVPDREWRLWLNGFQPDEADAGGLSGGSSGCEGAYLMTY